MIVGKSPAAATMLLLIAGCAYRGEKQIVAADPRCVLTEADKAANRTLTWQEFDLSPDRPKTSMWLSSAGCYRQAVDAGADYLATGPMLPVRGHSIVTFHMARNLARSGDHRAAAQLASASRRADQPPNAPLDWNTYVEGFYAYLTGNRALLDSSYERLVAAAGESNLTNARVLDRARRCFERPFVQIETRKECGPEE